MRCINDGQIVLFVPCLVRQAEKKRADMGTYLLLNWPLRAERSPQATLLEWMSIPSLQAYEDTRVRRTTSPFMSAE